MIRWGLIIRMRVVGKEAKSRGAQIKKNDAPLDPGTPASAQEVKGQRLWNVL